MPVSRFFLFASGALLIACGGETYRRLPIDEASGVTRRGDELLIVDDSDPGGYYRIPLEGTTGPVIPLANRRVARVGLPCSDLYLDLEGIDRLADGRIAILSERLRSLVGVDGLIAEYDAPFNEFGKRGLEGVTARPLADGASRVAVLWEGGYPDYSFLLPRLQELAGRVSLPPTVLVHDLKRGEAGVRLRMRDAVRTFSLEVPRPEGGEPYAQRFRAPDFIWCAIPSGSQPEWGFLVLISSQDSVERPKFLNHWLQRFDSNGHAVGGPIDIAKFAPAQMGHANWEGLGWFEPGKKVVLVHEGQPEAPPSALVIELPADWQFEPTGLLKP